jgi:hypothetical protein
MTVNLEAFARPCGSQIERPAPFPTQIQSGINLAVHSSNDVSVHNLPLGIFLSLQIKNYRFRFRHSQGGIGFPPQIPLRFDRASVKALSISFQLGQLPLNRS